MVTIRVIQNGPLQRELPAKYRSAAAEELFHEKSLAMRGAFLLEQPKGETYVREVAVLLMQALMAARGLTLSVQSCDSSDKGINMHQLQLRVAQLPLDPAVAPGTIFRLEASNPTNHYRTVTPREFEKPREWTVHPFPTQAELFNLAPGHTIALEARAAAVDAERPDAAAKRGGELAYAVAACPEGVGGDNPLTAEPRQMRLTFDTHAPMTPLSVLQQALAGAADSFRKISFDRMAVESGDHQLAPAADKMFSAPLGAAVDGAALLLARMAFLDKAPFVAPTVDHRQEMVVRIREVDAAAALRRLEAAQKKALAVLDALLEQVNGIR